MNFAKRLLGIVLVCFMLAGSIILSSAILYAQTDEQAELDTILTEFVDEDEPGVVVLVSVGDEQWISARGMADLGASTPLVTTDSFRIGSVTKTFVATLILQFVEENKLELDTPMSTWLSSDIVDNIEYGNEITLRHLLTMQSGIFDYTESGDFWEEVDANPAYAWTAEKTLDYVLGEAAYFAPGAEFYYTNTNYILLELIIQEITAMSLAEAMADYIFEPLDMANSYMEDGANLSPDIVQGYAYYDNDDELDNVTYINEGVGLGDGGIISTVYDLDIFIRALLTNDLLEAASLEQMRDFDDESAYGLGLSLDEFGDWQLIGHNGSTAGFQSAMYYLPEVDMSIILLTNNFDSEVTEDIVSAILVSATELLAEAN